MQEKYFREIYYRKNDFKKRKKYLILLHGLSSSSSAWLTYEKELGEKFNLIIPDLRGHGKSFRPRKSCDYKIEYFSKDLFNIINHEKIKKVAIVAHSFANLVAIDFLKNYQKRISSIIFVNPAYAPARNFIQKVMKYILWVTNIFNYFPNKKTGGHTNYPEYIGTSDWSLTRNFVEIINTGLKSYFNSYKQLCYFDEEKFLGKINVPSLIIAGRKDSMFPVQDAIKMSKRIKNSKIIILDKADHLIVLNWEKRLIKEIISFLRK